MLRFFFKKKNKIKVMSHDGAEPGTMNEENETLRNDDQDHTIPHNTVLVRTTAGTIYFSITTL